VAEGLVPLYRCQGQSTGGGTREPGVETKGGDPPTLLIGEELKIVKLPTPLVKPG
jgi:hypothetical protein